MKSWIALLSLVGCSAPAKEPAVRFDASLKATVSSAAQVGSNTPPGATPPEPPKRAPSTDVERANEFAARLFKNVANTNKDTNTTLAPTIVRLAMSLVHQGAKGETRSELEKAFHLHATDSGSDAGRELKHWKQRDAHIAIRLFAEKSAPLQPSFRDVAKDSFGSALDTLDFVGSPEPSRMLMNKWVATATENRISELFPEGTVSASTRFVVASAVHFKSTWQTPFEPKDTKPKPFFVLGSNAKQVPTMFQRGWFGFTEEEDVLVAALPYESAMKMVVAMPKDKTRLDALISRIDFAVLDGWNAALADGSRELLLELPKFELSAGGNLKPALQALGVNVAFTGAADYSGISDAKVPVTDVFHKTYIRVDEKGTEAAAASGFMLGAGGQPPPPTPFVVDRPFVYYLVDTFKGRVLFIGAIVDPTAKP